MANDIRDNKIPEQNRDPITGAPGAHPVGTGIGAAAGGLAGGAAAGAAAGALTGTAAGPIGTLIGTAAGAIIGGLAGKGVAEHFDPTAEDAYWRETYSSEPYYESGLTYDDYSPAYKVGYQGRADYGNRTWEDAEMDLQSNYQKTRGNSRLEWDDAKSASRAAWDRVERAIPGDFDKDGK